MTTKTGALLLAFAVIGGVSFLMEEDGTLNRIADAKGHTAGAAEHSQIVAADDADTQWADAEDASPLPPDAANRDRAEERHIAIAEYEPEQVAEAAPRRMAPPDPGRPRGPLTNDMPDGTIDTRFDPRLN